MDDYIDEIAVERAVKGDRTVHLNRAETAAALEICEKRGLSLRETGRLLGLTDRTVYRVRSGETAFPFSRPGVTVDNTKEKIAAALRHESVSIRRAAQRANQSIATLDTLLAEWGAKEAARERVAELEKALAEAKATLRGNRPATKKPGTTVHGKARAWAQANGIPVAPIGLVPRTVIEQWERATAGAA